MSNFQISCPCKKKKIILQMFLGNIKEQNKLIDTKTIFLNPNKEKKH
jgi:hypothetical protein